MSSAPIGVGRGSVLDRIKLPRLTFSWPQLELIGSTKSAEKFVLPPASTGQLFNEWLKHDNAPPTFDQIFKHPEPTDNSSTHAWVHSLLAQSDRDELDDRVFLRAHHFAHSTPATLFIAPPDDGILSSHGQDVLHVLLLGPGTAPDARPPPTLTPLEPRGALPAKAAPAPLSTEEVGKLLWEFTSGTLDSSEGQKVLNESELRMVLDEMPEIAFMLNNDGSASWFNKQASQPDPIATLPNCPA